MASLVVRDVPPQIIDAIKRRARRHGRSLEEEHLALLRTALQDELHGGSDIKATLASMPDVGVDDDFARERDFPR